MKKYINQINQLLLIPAFLFFTSCGSNPSTEEGLSSTDQEEEGFIKLTTEQTKQAEINTGTFTYQSLGDPVEANGTIELPPNNLASVNVPMEGFIEDIRFLEGAEVKKGQTLAVLRHPGYIQLQQDYVQAASRLTFLEKELERQKTLSEAKVSAEKTYQKTQSEYQATRAEVNGLKEKLHFLGISSENVLAGTIQSRVYLPTPFEGTVTTLNAHKGQLVTPQDVIMEVINREHMHVELQVFQRDIPKVREGQKIQFTVPAFENGHIYEGEVSLVGKNLDLDTKTIRVHGHFHEQEILIPGLYVEAQIITDSRVRRTLPEDAIIRDQGKYYYFVQLGIEGEDHLFKKVEVQVGINGLGVTEVAGLNDADDTTNIVTKGAYYLKSEMNKEAGGDGD